MTRTFSDGHPKVLPACNFLSQYYFYNIFLQKSCRFSLQTLTKFEAAKTGSGVGFLRLTAVWPVAGIEHTAVKRGARAQFPPKLSLNKVLNFRKFSLSSPKLRQSLKS